MNILKKKNHYTSHPETSFCWSVSIIKNHHKIISFFNCLINSSSKSDCHPPVCSVPTAVGFGVVGPKAPGTQAELCTWSNRAVFLYICFLSSCKKILATSSPSTHLCLLVFPLFLLKIILHDISMQIDCLLANGKYIHSKQFLWVLHMQPAILKKRLSCWQETWTPWWSKP